MIYNRIPRNYIPALPWTPAELTTALWLDADDYSTITLVSDKVSAWADKSGNSRNASQSTDSYRPTYSATGFNSKPTLSFDGSNDSLTLVQFAQALGQNAFAVVDTTNMGTSYRGFMERSSGTAANMLFAFGGVDYDRKPCVYWASGTHAQQPNPVTKKCILRWGIDTGPITYTQLDGNAEVSEELVATDLTNWSAICNTSIQQANVLISEIVMTPATLSEVNRQKLEGYLAHKWGHIGKSSSGSPL